MISKYHEYIRIHAHVYSVFEYMYVILQIYISLRICVHMHTFLVDLHRHVFKRCRSLSLVQYYHQMTVYYTVCTVIQYYSQVSIYRVPSPYNHLLTPPAPPTHTHLTHPPTHTKHTLTSPIHTIHIASTHQSYSTFTPPTHA